MTTEVMLTKIRVLVGFTLLYRQEKSKFSIDTPFTICAFIAIIATIAIIDFIILNLFHYFKCDYVR